MPTRDTPRGHALKTREYADSLRRASSFRIKSIQNLESLAHHTVAGLEVKARNAEIHRHDPKSGGPVSLWLQMSGEGKSDVVLYSYALAQLVQHWSW